jgi:hypothetical protein
LFQPAIEKRRKELGTMNRRTRNQWLSGAISSGQGWGHGRHQARSDSRRAQLDSLEGRRLLAAVVVNNAANTVNGDTSSIAALIATPGGDGISLREAILAANATAGTDSITLHPGLAGATIYAENLSISGSVDIKGPSGNPVILSGPAWIFQQFNGGGRMLDVAASATVSLANLSFYNGDATVESNGNGGAIRNAGSLTIRQSLFYNNGAGDAENGGPAKAAEPFTIRER